MGQRWSVGVMRSCFEFLPRVVRCAVDGALRALGQVLFQDSRGAGLLCAVGLALHDPALAGAALLAAAVASLVATALAVARVRVQAGLAGFNAALVGIACVHFLPAGIQCWVALVLAAAASTVLWRGLEPVLGRWRLPVLTAPFVLVALVLLFAAARLGSWQAQVSVAAVEQVVSAATLAHAVLNGVAQVFLQQGLATGAWIAAGLLLASRPAFAATLAGSLSGALLAWAMGAGESEIRAGLHGFNSALVALALTVVFPPASRREWLAALLAVALTPALAMLAASGLGALGLPALTLPFVLVTWLALAWRRWAPAA